MVICTKNHTHKHTPEKTTNDDELQIMDVVDNASFDCPFVVKLQKAETVGKWLVTYINSYHNHIFKKTLPQYFELQQKTCGEGLCKEGLVNEDWDASQHLFKSKATGNLQLSNEIQRKIEALWFEKCYKKRKIFAELTLTRFLFEQDIENHLEDFNPPKFGEIVHLQNMLLKLKQDNEKKDELKNLWYSYDNF